MVFIWITGSLALLIMSFFGIGRSLSTPGYRGEESPHFNGKKFINKEGVQAKGFGSVLRWAFQRDAGPWAKNYETITGPKPDSESEALQITFVNHSTFLIQWNQLNVLTDPIWSERCSPFSFAGPQRMRPPGIAFSDLPAVDIVVISHNHYDHLDMPTIMKLEESHQPLFIVPLGVDLQLKKKSIKNTIALDWWQSTNAGIKIEAVPAQHFSGRGMFDRDQTLWCGYILSHNDKQLYFAGDSGYGGLFKEIGKKRGPMDISLIPIGAYKPRWFMSPIHISPEEAVQVHQDVQSQQSVAMHFGTFPLADEGQGTAEQDLILALDEAGIPQKDFIIPAEGNPIQLPM